MCPATNSSLGVVKLFFASLDFEVTRPWVMPDGCCVTAYTAAELLLASPNVQRSILKISSRYSTRLLGTSTFPISILSQFSHAFFSSLGRSQSTIRYSIFPADLTGEANFKGLFISAIFLRISLLVTLTIGAGNATTIVSTALFHGTPSSLVSPVFTPIWYLAKLWLVSSIVVGCCPAISSTGVARLWLASCWVVECSSAAFSEAGGSSRDGTFECHLCSWNLLSLKICRAASFSTTVVTQVIRSST